MKHNKFGITDLVCLECGNVFSIMRRAGRYKGVAHIKDLWCYKCMNVTKHYEVVDVTKFMWRDTENETELHIKELIENGRYESKKRTNRVFKKILKR